MAHLQETETRRRADGSIDTGFYAARAEAMRKVELGRLVKGLLGLLALRAGRRRTLRMRKLRT